MWEPGVVLRTECQTVGKPGQENPRWIPGALETRGRERGERKEDRREEKRYCALSGR